MAASGQSRPPCITYSSFQLTLSAPPPTGWFLVTSSTQKKKKKDALMMEIDSVPLKHAAQISSIRVKDVSVVILKHFPVLPDGDLCYGRMKWFLLPFAVSL